MLAKNAWPLSFPLVTLDGLDQHQIWHKLAIFHLELYLIICLSQLRKT